jgi:hypothetical protein
MLRNLDIFGRAAWQWSRKLSAGIGMMLSMGITALLLAGPAQPPDPEVRLEAAIHREIVVGELRGALEQYRTILALPAKSREIAARALFQMGLCLEKLGQRREAHAAYTRVISEYGDETESAALARAQLAGWEDSLPGPRNLRFEQGAPGKAPPGWFVPALPKDADYIAELRRSGCRSRVGCAVVLVPANAPTPVASLMQSFSAAAYRGKTVRLRAWLKLEASDAGDRAQMLLSVDRANRQSGFSDNMNDRPVRSAEWTRCEIVCPVDRDATFINFGVLAIGRGRVWVDDVSFEVVR